MNLKLEKSDVIDIIENSISWIVVFGLFVYGFSKPIQFNHSISSQTNVSELTGQELMWYFYSYSNKYVLFLGAIEIIGAILILIPKTRLIGCLFSTAILTNIIIQDLIYHILPGALKAAIIYQLLIFIILFINKQKIIGSFKMLLHKKSNKIINLKFAFKLLITFLIFALLRFLEYFITMKT